MTSRIKSIHSFLKKYLVTSRHNLFRATKSLTDVVSIQIRTIQDIYDGQRGSRALDLLDHIFDGASSFVSNEAMRKVLQQKTLLASIKNRRLCTHRFSRSMVLPCVHKIIGMVLNDESLRVSDFGQHWHLLGAGESRQVFRDPITRVGRATTGSRWP